MKRRSPAQPDSLELLLDTMCNCFGGIILIALLVALLARDLETPTADAETGPEETPLSSRLQTAADDLAKAEAARQLLETESSNPELQEKLELTSRRQALREQAALLQWQIRSAETNVAEKRVSALTLPVEKLRELQQRLDETAQKRNAAREQAAASAEQLQTLQAQLEQVSEQSRAAAAARTRRLRLPRERSTEKKPFDIIIRFGELYPVQVLADGRKQRNITSLDWQPDIDGEYVLPIPGAGLNPATDAANVARFLQEIPSAEFYLVFRVYADSFATFNRVKEAVIRLGYEFSWDPLENHQKLKAGSGARPPPPL